MTDQLYCYCFYLPLTHQRLAKNSAINKIRHVGEQENSQKWHKIHSLSYNAVCVCVCGTFQKQLGFHYCKGFWIFFSLSLSQQSFLFMFCTHKTSKSLQKPAKLCGIFGDGGERKKQETVRNRFHHSRQSPTRTNLMDLFFICFLFVLRFFSFFLVLELRGWVGGWVPGAATVAEGSARENGSSIDGSNRGWGGTKHGKALVEL